MMVLKVGKNSIKGYKTKKSCPGQDFFLIFNVGLFAELVSYR